MLILSNNRKNLANSLLQFVFLITLLFSSCTNKKKINNQIQNSNNISDSGIRPEKQEITQVRNVPTDQLILNESELGNAKLDQKWSGETANGLSKTFRKKIDNYRERDIVLELYQFPDAVVAKQRFQEDFESHFSKKVSDGNGGLKRNPFLSEKINIENIGDSTFCYKFVSPTIEVLYGKFIIACNVTINYVYENLSENNSETLKKAKEIIRQQIEKIENETNK